MNLLSFIGKIFERALEPRLAPVSKNDIGWVSSSPVGYSQFVESKNSDFFGISHSLRNLFIRKTHEEIDYERRRKMFEAKVINALEAYCMYDIHDIDLSVMSDMELMNILAHVSNNNDYYSLVQDYHALNRSSRLLNAINRSIKRLLNNSKKLFRNLKRIFHRHHSFHFKNLDDYHSYSLVNIEALARA